LVKKFSDGRTGLSYLTYDQVQPLLGGESHFGQGETSREPVVAAVSKLESARLRGPRVVFLGTSIPQSLPARLVRAVVESGDSHKYTSYFSFDVSGHVTPALLDTLLQPLTNEGPGLFFIEPRSAAAGFSNFDAGLFAEARSIVDWNFRNKV
jgi:NAD+ diphosphatase